MVIATSRPTLRLPCKCNFQTRQHSVEVPHDLLICETDHIETGCSFQNPVPDKVVLRVVGIAIDLDHERKATMVSNLMVVLCGEREAQPVVNAGTLYQ